ncbi:ABC transporter ATP-binding protein [Stutzerimonas kirkiae]|uniref:ABC transporter ATP-binding protein n=1 Tax=Stutzerimonas kirkiae TaxID=2211392 RepID=UPI0010385515|nr:ABC transporter ATP-binding protein [Stutzerimonas kirkiae]TBV11475.1 ABC transporter ATP-binding protein [Stutzerimonas kirkiae]
MTADTSKPSSKKALPVLQLVNVCRSFGDFTAVSGISLDIREGEFLTIVGPSGSGKTTMLRMLAGMDAPSSGNITLRGELINQVPARRRPTCLVFQSLALFPHKSVGENIEFPLKVKKMPPAQRRERALELLRMLRLPEDYYGKNVMKCSGGERQRVALARAFAYDPDVLLFDEPLSALDYKLKKVLEKELKDLHRTTGKTFIYITHSLEEAMVMSDRIAVMRGGRVVQIGDPETIYANPADDFVAEFFGEVNKFRVSFSHAGGWYDQATAQRLEIHPGTELASATEALVVVRPEYMHFVEAGGHYDNVLEGEVFNEYSLGSRIQYQVRCADTSVLVEVPRTWSGSVRAGDRVSIGFNASDALVAGV